MESIETYKSLPSRAKPSWKTVILCVFAVISLVLAGNLAAWAYLEAFPVNRGLTRVWQKWQLLERQTKPVDWLILGDSTCGQGIIPTVIEADTAESALNLCTIANATAVNGIWQIERYLKKVGTPKRIVVIHAYHVWERSTDDLVSMLGQIPLKGAFYNRLDPPLHIGWLGEMEIATRPLRTLWDSNLSIEYVLKREGRALFSNKPFERSEALHEMRFIERFKGYVGSNTAMPERVISQSKSSMKAYAKRPFVITRPNREALEALCRISKTTDSKIFLANSSISRMLYADQGFQRFYSQMVQSISEILSDCPNVKYVMKVPGQFEPNEMDNEDHVVTDPVASRWTRQLVDAVKEAEAGSK